MSVGVFVRLNRGKKFTRRPAAWYSSKMNLRSLSARLGKYIEHGLGRRKPTLPTTTREIPFARTDTLVPVVKDEVVSELTPTSASIAAVTTQSTSPLPRLLNPQRRSTGAEQSRSRIYEDVDPFDGEGTILDELEARIESALTGHYRVDAAALSDDASKLLEDLKNLDVFLTLREEAKKYSPGMVWPEGQRNTLQKLSRTLEANFSSDASGREICKLTSQECSVNLKRSLRHVAQYRNKTSYTASIVIRSACRRAGYQVLMTQGLIERNDDVLSRQQAGLGIMLNEADNVTWSDESAYNNFLSSVAAIKSGKYYVEDGHLEMMTAHKETPIPYAKKPKKETDDGHPAMFLPEKIYEMNGINAAWRAGIHPPLLGLATSISAMVYLRNYLKDLPGTIGGLAISTQLISLLYKGHNLKYCNIAADFLESQEVNELSNVNYKALVDPARVAGYDDKRYLNIKTLEGKKKVLQLREKCRDLHALRFERQSKIPTSICVVVGSALGAKYAYQAGNPIAGILTGVAIGVITLNDFITSRYTWPIASAKPEFESKVAKLLRQGHTSAQVAKELNRTKPKRTRWLIGSFPALAAYLSSSKSITSEEVEKWAKAGDYEKQKND
jgi:hypothetical protein